MYGRADGPRGLYENWDFDQDGNITINEVSKFRIRFAVDMFSFWTI